ncbi:MAG: glycosyltransferase family 4 protein [Ktedonobacteraceae bacterium]|nr:glycosyltransferase family 4 protein [Ktedonobacteraceae bacterium]
MKIAHIAPAWIAVPPEHYGGTEVVLHNLVEEQRVLGHDVTLLAPGDARTTAKLVSFYPQSLLKEGRPWSAHLKAFYHLFKSVEYVKEHDFDIVHTHLSSAADMYIFPLTARLAIPHIMTLHSRFPFDRVDNWVGDADKFFMEWAISVPMVAISQCAREKVPYPLNFVGVVHHGLPTHLFAPVVERPEDFFVWLGRFMPEKGAHLAIQAARRAGIRLILAGVIDNHVRTSVEYFESQIEPFLDHEQVKYIGPVNMEQKVHLLSRARGLLNPIEWEEPFGVVMIEAMAAGCPVISFARGSAPEIVVHGRSGFLVHDVDEMISSLLRVDALDRAVVRAHVEEHFSVRAMAEKYLALYKKVRAMKLLGISSSVSTVQRPSWLPVVLNRSEAADRRFLVTAGEQGEDRKNVLAKLDNL